MNRKTLSLQAIQELSGLAGVNLPPERLDRFIPRLVSFFQDMGELDKIDVGDLAPDFIQPQGEGDL